MSVLKMCPSQTSLLFTSTRLEHWPHQLSSTYVQASGTREAYLARRTALREFKFIDPSIRHYFIDPRPYNHMLLDRNCIILSQGSKIQILYTDASGANSSVTLQDHNARITCMRSFSLKETSLFRSKGKQKDNFLVTSSSDHSIRLWWEDCCQRCFRGHNGPVTTIAHKLLGGYNEKFLASGGEDGTVRLWSITSSGKRGQHALRKTFYGHEKPIAFLSVSGHKTSLLVSISKDTKVRVWDTTATRSSGCVGMTSVVGAPIDMKCHESLCYVAAGSSVTSIDLRTMRKAFTAAVHPPKFNSFEMLPSKSLICTGGNEKAMLWDIRKAQEKPEPVAMLEGHEGPVSQLHMDAYKVVTGSPEDPLVRVWETSTGTLANSFMCGIPDESESKIGCSAMAVDACRIVTASCGDEPGLVCFRDFTKATLPLLTNEDALSSKFWEPPQIQFDTNN
ncbi:WD40 repeat [Macleaya cordata]|uniref:WD40 repeat n=1 Tax=Macleaya cordata TaxID=56857 RepID=A0A200QS56_MACCD|nr:WD40 repeat [Macleaya cordata]